MFRLATPLSILSGFLASFVLVQSLYAQNVRAAEYYTIDPLHPKSFVDVFEVDRRGMQHVITRATNVTTTDTPPATVRLVNEAINAEVDRRSRIVIAFDRDWIKGNESYEGVITIVAHSGTRPVEVPGYFVTGEGQDTASVRIRSTRDLQNVLTEISEARLRFLTSFEQVDSTDVVTAARTIIGSLEADFEEVFGEYTDVRDRLDPLMLARRARELEPEESAEIERLRGNERSLSGRLDSLSRAIERVNDSLLVETRVTELLAQRRVIRIPLAELADTASRDVAEALGIAAGRHPGVVSQIAADIIGHWLPMMDTASILEAKRNAFDEVMSGLDVLDSIALKVASDSLRTRQAVADYFVGKLRDSEILLSSASLRPGDELTIRISNVADGPGTPRTLQIRLQVQEFGGLRRITDSFLFIKRLDVAEPDPSAMALPAPRGGQAVETPKELNFVPTPGASLWWTYRPRKGLLRVVQPGGGINVSFPRFGSTIATFTPPDPNDQNSMGLVTVEDSDNPIDLAVGLLGSLFDGLVQTTVGWALTASEKRFYWGLGFSFVQLGTKVSAGITAEEGG